MVDGRVVGGSVGVGATVVGGGVVGVTITLIGGARVVPVVGGSVGGGVGLRRGGGAR